ncbi:hypothetical protein MRB53_039256 [Persea americana]|nr:hypothetical protein MRB53_039256 [Persea americana]
MRAANHDTDAKQAGFLKSSPKVTLHPKPHKGSPASNGTSARPQSFGGPARISSQINKPPNVSNATWICPICSFSNPVPSNFDPTLANEATPLPPCLACGIKPPLVTVVKAAIASLSTRTQKHPQHAQLSEPRSSVDAARSKGSMLVSVACPRCTFMNHASLRACEMCGAALRIDPDHERPDEGSARAGSPAPIRNSGTPGQDANESVKFSFRAGGEKTFLERLKGALTQRKWLLRSAPPVPRSGQPGSSPGGSNLSSSPLRRNIGIAGLERRDSELRKNNEVIIGNAFEDLQALMASAKEIIALAETFAKHTKASSDNTTDSSPPDAATVLSQLNLATTKEMLGSSASSRALYLSELARSIAEFLTDDKMPHLRRAGGTISLVDLWALFNRMRGGVELVSPSDFAAATEHFDRLKLPVRLRKFKSGLQVVQGRDRSDEKTIAAILEWLKDLGSVPPERTPAWDWSLWGCGVTALDAAERFGWSVGVATARARDGRRARGPLPRCHARRDTLLGEFACQERLALHKGVEQEANQASPSGLSSSFFYGKTSS